jgi:acyl carrier protein
MSDNKVLAQVYDALDIINDQNEEFRIEKSRETVLFGKGGGLDSLGLVNLIIAIEQNIEDEFDVNITIAHCLIYGVHYSWLDKDLKKGAEMIWGRI